MVREDILGGLRNALARGQSLKQAMMSFYNAGYIKQEIEEAAKALQIEKSQPLQQFTPVPGQVAPIFQRTSAVKQDIGEKPKEILSQTAKLKQPQTVQKVSAYGPPAQPAQPQPIQQSVQQQVQLAQLQQLQQLQQMPKPIQKPLKEERPRGKGVIFILLALLIILIGGLIAVFFFKDDILAFFESI